MVEKTAKRLLRLLETERGAITRGDFDALPQLGADKEDLFAALSKSPPSLEVVSRLTTETTRNQRLLEAAMQGMRAAAQTLETMQEAQKGSMIYGSDGKVSRLSKGDQRVSQKL